LTKVDGIEYTLLDSEVIVRPDGLIGGEGEGEGEGEGDGPLYWFVIVHLIGTPPLAVPEQLDE
jgi:hypothetical protein